MTNTTRTALLTLSLVVTSLAAHAFAAPIDPIEPGDDPAYVLGKKALDEQRWRDAVREFDKIIDTKGDRADGAHYWKAYALNKMHHGTEAMAECDALKARFPKSEWNNDCKALAFDTAVTVGGGRLMVFNTGNGELRTGGVYVTPDVRVYTRGRGSDPESDMKLLALNSLLRENPDKALPQLRSLLAGNSSEDLKRHAILMLAQSKNPEAQKILDDAVRGKMGSNVQLNSIQMSGVFHRMSSGAFVDVYKSTGDAKVKQSVLQALYITHDADKLVDLARGEKDLEMKRQIVSQLALMHDKVAQDYMLELLK